jgi:hypothetical protein
VADGQPKPARRAVAGAVRLQLQQVARRLLLEPLADVPLVQACGVCELAGFHRPTVGEDPVEAEPVAEVDGKEVERTDRIRHQALDERIAPLSGINRDNHAPCRAPILLGRLRESNGATTP